MFSIVDGAYVQVQLDEHRKVVFGAHFYQTTQLEVSDRLFDELNGYINTLSDAAREELFELYQAAYEYLEIGSNTAMIEGPLADIVGQIYHHIEFDNLRGYIWANRQIIYPANVKDNHDTDDKQARDRTYLRSEYFDLAVFTIWMRPMIPIWGMYVPIVEAESGAARKEYMAFRIVHNTPIPSCDVIDRLSAYVEAVDGYSKLENINTVAITGSLSSAETLPWILNTTIIRRISCGQIDADEYTGHLVSSVWNYVKYLVNGYESKFGSVIHPKKPPGNSEEEKPVIDRIRSAQKESLGEMAVYAVYLSKRHNVLEDIDPTIPASVIDALSVGSVGTVEQFQQILAQWCLSPVMTPYALENIVTRRTMKDNVLLDEDGNVLRVNTEMFAQLVMNPIDDAILITRTLLWHWGFPVLALLVNAKRDVNDDTISSEANDRIQSKTLQSLMEYFPHSTIKKVPNERRRNIPYVAADAVSKMIGYSAWFVDYPPEMHDVVKPYLDAGGKLRVPSDLAEQLALLTIKIVDIKKQMKLNSETLTHEL